MICLRWFCALVLAMPLPVFANWKPSSHAPLPNNTWIDTHQRLCFGVDSDTLDEAIDSGVNVIVGGTNAAGYGFAGGPFCLDRDGETVIHILTGEPIPEEVLAKMRENVDRAHARGAKVLGEVIRLHMTPWLQAEHPEWQIVNSPGEKPIRADQVKDIHVLGCWNSPYGDFFIQSQVVLLKKLDYDGYNLDGFGCWAQCFCPTCMETYKADTGKDIPAYTNVNEPDFRMYLKWKLDRFTKFVARWTAEMKKVKPDFVCAPWSTGPGRWWHWMGAPAAEGSDTMHRVLDAPFLELLWDFPPDQGSNLLPAFTVRYYRGLCGGDRAPWILPYLCEQGQFNMQPPPVECDLRLLTVLTNGGLAANGIWQQNTDVSPLSHFNKLIEEREPFTRNAKSVKWAAMLVGESSRLLYGLPGVRNEVPMGAWMGSGVDSPSMGALAAGERRMPAHMESAVGVFRAMMEDHQPLDIIIEPDVENLKTLKQYKVLILPNAACLSDNAVKNIREFVNSGGGLVAMHETSLCDEFGTRRENFGLSDLFGATFKGTVDYSGRWPNFPSLTEIYVGISGADIHEITYDPVIRSHYRRASDRLNYIGWATNVEVSKDARQIGRRLEAKEWPFMTVNEPGEGRSAYFAADLGQAYFLAPYRYQRRMIANAARWAAGENAAPFQVEAPMCVQAAYYEQDGGKRQLVHLLNEINTTADRAIPENNPSAREEIIPMVDIKVTSRNPNVTSAFLEPGHQKLELTKTDDGMQVTVPRLDLHAIVVFE